MNHPQFEYLIVGGGTAGCVVANRLSESQRHRVLLLEAGPPDRSPWIHLPIGYGKTMFHPRLNWQFRTEPEAHLDGRSIYWPRGRCLGGSSSINGLIYIRGQAEDFNDWRDQGNPGWGWDDMLPAFRRAERNSRGASDYHGDVGPQSVSDICETHPLMEAIIQAAGEIGIAANGDFNGERQEGVGYYQLTTRNGLRSSAATAYLKPARGRDNLSIETGAHTTRILFDGPRAIGVEYRQGGTLRRAYASREVIVCAGAVQSPQLLMCSGVGNGGDLQQLGIPLVAHLPGVGENLQDHLQLRLSYKVTRPITTNDDLNSLWGRLRIGSRWLLRRRGPLAVGINQGGLFTRVLAESSRPDVQFHFSTLSADQAGGKPHAWPGCTFSVCQLRPESRGNIRIRSADSNVAPIIRANYLERDPDRRTAIAGLRLARRLAAAPALRGLLAEEHAPGAAYGDDDQSLLAAARKIGATIFHPVGTCAMGRHQHSVVDARLSVRGVSSLRVIDASVMPTLVSGNTAATTIAIAERGSDFILADGE